MQLFRVMVLFAGLCVCTFSAQAQFTELEVSETVYPNKVTYIIDNPGTESVSIAYIVIQDNVLIKAQGGTTILAGDSFTIHVDCENAPSHTFDLQLTEED